MMESTYSVSSFDGLVSSNRRLHLPPNSSASPKFKLIDLAWPMCRYPFGSGGKRVCTRPPYLLVFKSSMMMSRTKLETGASESATSGSVMGVFMSLFLLCNVGQALSPANLRTSSTDGYHGTHRHPGYHSLAVAARLHM